MANVKWSAFPAGTAIVSSDGPVGLQSAVNVQWTWAQARIFLLLPLAAGTNTVAPLLYQTGTNLTTATAGACEYDGIQHYKTIDTTSGRGAVPVEQYFHLTADGGAISTVANFFGATSNISLVANGVYIIETYMAFLNTTVGTVTWTLLNAAQPANQNIYYEQSPITGVVSPPGQATNLVGYTIKDTTASLSYTTGTLNDAVDHLVHMKIALANGSGTSLKIQATKNVGGSITPRRGSYWTCRRLSPTPVGTFVA